MDYLFSPRAEDADRLSRSLAYIRQDCDPKTLQTWRGDWGVLVSIGEPYPGFVPVESESRVILVLGGPLPRHELVEGDAPDRFSSWIADQLEGEQLLNWGEMLIGGFQIVEILKHQKTVRVINDVGGFVPFYTHHDDNSVTQVDGIGSHADALASAMEQKPAVDEVSVADFLVHQTTAFPHTMYQKVLQCPPGHVHELGAPNSTMNSTAYWSMDETNNPLGIEAGAKLLRDAVTQTLQTICHYSRRVKVLMSGGEDSRVILSLVPESVDRLAFTVTDSYNREARIAQRVSKMVGADWVNAHRSDSFYLDNAKSSVRLSESHNFFYHAHFNGIHNTLQSGHEPVLGGLMADAFCKGSHVLDKNDPVNSGWQYLGVPRPLDLPDSLGREVYLRRERHNNRLRKNRPLSWPEWHSLYPATMNTSATNYLVGRRLFRSYEVFSDFSVIDWSIRIPVPAKLKRKAFHKAFQPAFKRTWLVPHGKGTFPYFGHAVNDSLLYVTGLKKRAVRKVRHKLGFGRGVNDGPWPVWKDVVQTELYKSLMKAPQLNLLGADAERAYDNATRSRDPVQALAALQVKLWLDQIENFHSTESDTEST